MTRFLSRGSITLWIGLALCAAVFILYLYINDQTGSRVTYDEPQQKGIVMPDRKMLEAAFDTVRSGSRLASFSENDAAGYSGAGEQLHSPESAFLRGNKIEERVAALVEEGELARLEKDSALPEGEKRVIEGKVGQGDTLASVLASLGAENQEELLKAAKAVLPLKELKAGQSWKAVFAVQSSQLERFEYEIDDASQLILEDYEKPHASLKKHAPDLALERVHGIIRDNLFKTVSDLGEAPQLAMSLVKLFGSEINFIRNIKDGDSFTVLVEKKYSKGKFAGYGRILAARFKNRGKTHEAYLFRTASGKAQYFNGKGENLHKTLLQAPLEVTRMTSRFSHNRLHPILNTSRPHLGVDYAAPTGTPVRVVGDGTVTEKGWSGGYGNLIVVKHDGGLESMYAHLSRYAKNLKPGKKLKQGEVIGYVGSTGLATGPHLDFRLRQNGKYINPEKAVNPRAAPVSGKLRKEFSRLVSEERAYLDGLKKIENYTAESLVPTVLSAAGEETREAVKSGGNNRNKKNLMRKRGNDRRLSARKGATARARATLSAVRKKIGRELAARLQLRRR